MGWILLEGPKYLPCKDRDYEEGQETYFDKLERHLGGHVDAFDVVFVGLVMFTLRSEGVSSSEVFFAFLLPFDFGSFLGWEGAAVEDDVGLDLMVSQ